MKLLSKLSILLFLVVYHSPTLKAQYKAGYKERGIISYYTDKFADRKTANGEKFDNTDLVACHNQIPFDSKVKVTNLANGRSVIVRINDRGPYAYGRIMDISKAAALKIDLISTGTAKVEIELLPQTEETEGNKPEGPSEKSGTAIASQNPATTESSASASSFSLDQTYSQWGTALNPSGYTIQLIGYSSPEKAQEYCKMLRKNGFEDEKIFIRAEKSSNDTLYKVLLGEFENKEDAVILEKKYLHLIKKKGYVRPFQR